VRLSARAVVIPGDDVDTDVLYPGQFLNITTVGSMREHLFEGLDPTLRERLGGDTALVVGRNFGAGSSREHVPQAMRASGIRFVVGRGFARIFSRNALNLGIPCVVSDEAVGLAKDDSTLGLDLGAGTLTVDGTTLAVPVYPSFMRELVSAGGLVPWTRARLLGATTRVV
jgi:3-isopropylmalate/(R)-2-methylmalate dehydratase small subunit